MSANGPSNPLSIKIDKNDHLIVIDGNETHHYESAEALESLYKFLQQNKKKIHLAGINNINKVFVYLYGIYEVYSSSGYKRNAQFINKKTNCMAAKKCFELIYEQVKEELNLNQVMMPSENEKFNSDSIFWLIIKFESEHSPLWVKQLLDKFKLPLEVITADGALTLMHLVWEQDKYNWKDRELFEEIFSKILDQHLNDLKIEDFICRDGHGYDLHSSVLFWLLKEHNINTFCRIVNHFFDEIPLELYITYDVGETMFNWLSEYHSSSPTYKRIKDLMIEHASIGDFVGPSDGGWLEGSPLWCFAKYDAEMFARVLQHFNYEIPLEYLLRKDVKYGNLNSIVDLLTYQIGSDQSYDRSELKKILINTTFCSALDYEHLELKLHEQGFLKDLDYHYLANKLSKNKFNEIRQLMQNKAQLLSYINNSTIVDLPLLQKLANSAFKAGYLRAYYDMGLYLTKMTSIGSNYLKDAVLAFYNVPVSSIKFDASRIQIVSLCHGWNISRPTFHKLEITSEYIKKILGCLYQIQSVSLRNEEILSFARQIIAVCSDSAEPIINEEIFTITDISNDIEETVDIIDGIILDFLIKSVKPAENEIYADDAAAIASSSYTPQLSSHSAQSGNRDRDDSSPDSDMLKRQRKS
tara:strand:+ start:16150 stop:18066 length:1917 start_codon:yes stop_codon:yes gene_type:complete